MQFAGRPDQEDMELMTETSRHDDDDQKSWIIFLCFHLVPFIVFVICRYLSIPAILLGIAILVFEIVAIYYTKNNYGWSLVGIKWCFDKDKQPEFPYITFTARSLPFVATAFSSNVFWLTLFFSTIFWILITVKYIYINEADLSVFLALVSAVNVINVNFFIRCHQVAKTQADIQARNVLLDACAEFPNITGDDQHDFEEHQHIPDPIPKTSVKTPAAPIPAQIPAKRPENPTPPLQPTQNTISTPPPKQTTTPPPPAKDEPPVGDFQQPTFEPSFEPTFDAQFDDSKNDGPTFEADFGDNKKEDTSLPTFGSFAPEFSNPAANNDDDEEAVVFGDAEDIVSGSDDDIPKFD